MLEVNNLALPSGTFVQTPFLMVAGLNSFMLIYTVPDLILGTLQITVENPQDNVSTLVDVCTYSPGGNIGGGTFILQFGDQAAAAAQDFVNAVGPGTLNTPAKLIWWVFSIAVENFDAIDTTATLRLWGARR